MTQTDLSLWDSDNPETIVERIQRRAEAALKKPSETIDIGIVHKWECRHCGYDLESILAPHHCPECDEIDGLEPLEGSRQ